MSIFGSETKLALKNERKSTGSIDFSSPAKTAQITPKAKMLAKQPAPNIPPIITNSGSPTHQPGLPNKSSLSKPLVKKLLVAFSSSDQEDESGGTEEEETSQENKTIASAKQRMSVEEDEEESKEEDMTKTAKSKVLKTSQNTASCDSNLFPLGYSVLTPSGMISAETLRDPDNEIYLVKLPSSVKAKSLINKPLPLIAGKKVVIDGKELETVTYQGTKGNTLVLAENREGGLEAVNISLAGNVHFQTILDVPSLPPLIEWPRPEPPLRELPSDLKVRHPLLGSDYEAILAGLASKEKKSRKKKASLPQFGEGQPVLTPEPSKKKKRIKKETN